MPMLTTSVKAPPCPLTPPSRMAVEKCAMRARTAFTSGMTSWPSTKTGVLERLRSAVCSTARPSVRLIGSPRNIASRFSATPVFWASSSRSVRARASMLVFEKSRSMSSNRAENCPKRSGLFSKREGMGRPSAAAPACSSAVQMSSGMAYPRGRAAASRARASISSQRPAFISFASATQEPPTQSTLGSFR